MRGQATRDRELRNWLVAQNPQLSPTIGSLRQEEIFKNNKTSFSLDFLENLSRIKSATERLLNTNDGFVAHSIGVFLLRVIKGQEGASLPQSYVNGSVFPKSGTFDPEHLDGVLYNGSMEIRNNNVILAKQIDLLRFRKVPKQQKTNDIRILGEQVSEVKQVVLGQKDEFDIEKMITDIEPYFMVSGGKKPQVNLSLPVFENAQIQSVENNVDYKICVILYGMHLESGAKAVEALAGNLGAIKKARIAQRKKVA